MDDVAVPSLPIESLGDVVIAVRHRHQGSLRLLARQLSNFRHHRPREQHRYPSGNPINQQCTPFADSSIRYADAAHQCAG
jgi:hypothetical protein